MRGSTKDERVPELTVEQFRLLIGKTPEHARACYVVLAATGMRLGEYVRCQKEDLNPDTFTVRVPGTKTATSRATIAVHPDLWGWIEAAIPSPLQSNRMRKYLKRAVTELGLPDLRLHDLRHLFAQLATQAGAHTSQVQVALRHANPAMTARHQRQVDRGDVARLVGNELVGRRFSAEQAVQSVLGEGKRGDRGTSPRHIKERAVSWGLLSSSESHRAAR